MRDIMSQALVALPALAQINLLSPVNTPFPGRIWAADTFIFSGIWENTRGGFVRHSVRRQAWAPSASPASVQPRPHALRNAACDLHGVCRSSFFVCCSLSSVTRLSSREQLALFCCLHTFQAFRVSHGLFGWWTRERFSTGDASDRLSAHTGAQTRRQNTICQARSR